MKKTMNIFTKIIHWTAFLYFVYLFGYASLYKLFRIPGMMEGMASLGFNEVWTVCIGLAELLGVLALLAGLWYRPIKNAATIGLLFFAVGALMVHFAHKDYSDFYDALFGSIAAVLLLVTDRHFRIVL